MKAFMSGLKERYKRAVAANEVEPEVRPFINWQGIKDGALGYECKTDAEIMRNVGSVNRARLAEIVSLNNRKAWFVAAPLVVAMAAAAYAGFQASTNPTGAVEFRPTGSLFAARDVSKEEVADLQASIRSTMTARIAGSYAKAIQSGLTTRYPNWSQKDITAADFDAAGRVAPAEQQVIADRCAKNIVAGYACSSAESLLYRFVKYEDGAKAKSADEARQLFMVPGQELIKTYLSDSQFDDICKSPHSEKMFFSAMSHPKADELISSIQGAWMNEGKLPEGLAKASSKADFVKASSLKGCAFQPVMSLAANEGPFKHLVQVYYTSQGLSLKGVWIGLAEDNGRRDARVMGCSDESCSNFGLREMDYSRSGKAADFLKSITTEGK